MRAVNRSRYDDFIGVDSEHPADRFLEPVLLDDVKIVLTDVDPIQILIKQREKNVCLVEFPVTEPDRIENDRIVHVYRSSMSPDIRSRVVQ